MVVAIRNLARWIAWQFGESEHLALADQPPARITVFSTGDA
jgi:hypothetical protein